MSKTPWGANPVIKTPNGDYTPVSDDLAAELKAAAASRGMKPFFVKIDGEYISGPWALQTNSIAALAADVSIEAVEVEPKVTGA